MKLKTMLANMCFCSHNLLEAITDPQLRESMFICTSHTVACAIARNTKYGADGVETNIILAELVNPAQMTYVFWTHTIQKIADGFGGWI